MCAAAIFLIGVSRTHRRQPSPAVYVATMVSSATKALAISDQMLARAEKVKRMGEYVGLFEFAAFSEIFKRNVVTYVDEGATDVRALLASALAPLADVEAVHIIGCSIGLRGVLALPQMVDGSLILSHWVVGKKLEGVSPPPVGDGSFRSAMLVKHGLVVRETQALGDCGIDVWAFALGRERKAPTFFELRHELAAFINLKADDKVWQEIFELCAESAPMTVPDGKKTSSASAKCKKTSSASAKYSLAVPVFSQADAALIEPMAFAFGEVVGPPVPLTSGGCPSSSDASLGASAIPLFKPIGVSHSSEPSTSASATVPFLDKAVSVIESDGAELAKAKKVTSFREYLVSLIASDLAKVTSSYDTFGAAEDLRHVVARRPMNSTACDASQHSTRQHYWIAL